MPKTLQDLRDERVLRPPRACQHAWVSIDPGIKHTPVVLVLRFDDPDEPTLRIAAGRNYAMAEALISLQVDAANAELGSTMAEDQAAFHDDWLPFLRAEDAFLQANPFLTPARETVLSWIRYEMMRLCPEVQKKETWALERVIPVLEQLRITATIGAVRTVREPEPVPTYVQLAVRAIAGKLIDGRVDFQEESLPAGPFIVPVDVIQDFAKSQAA